MSLDYPGELDVLARVLIKRETEGSEREKEM